MDLNAYFKAVVDGDPAPVVVCGPDHTVLYVNPAAAARYDYAGGANLVGTSILDCHSPQTAQVMEQIWAWFQESVQNNRVFEGHNPKENKDVYMVALRGEDGQLLGYYEKHEYRTAEANPKFHPLQL